MMNKEGVSVAKELPLAENKRKRSSHLRPLVSQKSGSPIKKKAQMSQVHRQVCQGNGVVPWGILILGIRRGGHQS